MSPITVVNKYIYAGNNPLMYTDPTGRDIWGDILGGLGVIAGIVYGVFTGDVVDAGAIIGASLGVIDNNQNGGNWLSEVGQGAIGGALFGDTFGMGTAGITTGTLSLGVAAANAGADGGNFLNSFIGHLDQTAAMAWFGAAAFTSASQLTSIPLVGGIFTPVMTAVTYAGYGADAATAIGLVNTECDRSKYGLATTNPGICGY